MEIIYKAFDGQEFNDVHKCILHEAKRKKDIVAVDDIGNLINSTKIEEIAKQAYVIKLENQEAVKVFCFERSKLGYSIKGIVEPNIYFYNATNSIYFIDLVDSDIWITLEEYKDCINVLQTQLQVAIEKLGGE